MSPRHSVLTALHKSVFAAPLFPAVDHFSPLLLSEEISGESGDTFVLEIVTYSVSSLCVVLLLFLLLRVSLTLLSSDGTVSHICCFSIAVPSVEFV